MSGILGVEIQTVPPSPYFDQDGITMYLGDCRAILPTLADRSVSTCVTSPPYWGLRDYGHENQIGQEKYPWDYVETIVKIFREVRRVLRDDGTLWLNLGDTYASSGGSVGRTKDDNNSTDRLLRSGMINSQPNRVELDGIKPKNLVGIPWRVAFALQNDGWNLRQDIVWHKPNTMPESVRDRCTKSHEYIFLLSKSERYYFNHEAIQEPAICGQLPGNNSHKGETAYDEGDQHHRTKGGLVAYAKKVRQSATKGSFNGKTEAMADTGQDAFRAVVDMRNKRSVWTVSLKPYKDAHFATYPPELIEPCIRAGCPEGGLVLDPFIGSGTTAAVALKWGCRFVGCEVNVKYLELAKKRFRQRGLPFDAC